MADSKTAEYPVVWFAAGACTGCSVSLLNTVSPTIRNLLVDEVLPGKHVSLKFHATVMAGQGQQALDILADTEQKGGFVLVVEGALTGEFSERAAALAQKALACIAMGTCSAFGGIPAAKPNPANYTSLGALLKSRGIATPVINVPGCPPHPDWFVSTVASVLLAGLPQPSDIDELGRPKAFYGQTIHDNCPRRGHYDEGKFAKKLSDPGCLYEVGCKGPVTYADCPTRLWNHGVNWCIGAGGPCLGCTEPAFPDLVSPFYEKLRQTVVSGIGGIQKEG